MKSSSSKILKLGGIIGLGIFGLAGFIYWKRIKNVSENRTEEGNAQKSDADPETTKEMNQDEDVKPASVKTKKKTEFSSAEELIEDTLRTVLKEDQFGSSDEFLNNFITIATTTCDDYSWFDYFPKNSDELREVLDKYGLLKQFDVQLYNKFMKK